MERLWIANIAPETTDEELKALVTKYSGEPIECKEIQRVEGDGSRPAVLMTSRESSSIRSASSRCALTGCTGRAVRSVARRCWAELPPWRRTQFPTVRPCGRSERRCPPSARSTNVMAHLER